MTLDRHSSTQVAALIYESAPELFRILFGDRAIPVLSMLVERSHNRFSHRYIWVAEQEGEVIGVVVLVPTECLPDQADANAVLSLGQRLWVEAVQRFFLNAILRHDYPAQTLYIGNLAVRADCRGQGIGTALLQQCISQAEQVKAQSLFISVDIDNPRAQALYESLGFCPMDTLTRRLFGRIVGSTVLEKTLTSMPSAPE
ncbi:MAG: GNAT family N-acetyltransferase [Synechococcales cyanobacterium T60_A2020_003]|nr:GNAT family N-acetyltransferase [Synechococcales cyanobacterium T60_A2020_003]